MQKEIVQNKVEVHVGHRVLVSDGRPRFVGEIARFRGKRLGYYIESSTIDDDRLKRKDVYNELYRCPDGYRVSRQEVYYRRRRERARWHAQEAFVSLLPVVNRDDAGHDGSPPVYGTYTEEEARREYPKLFSAVGLPNVRDLD